MSFAGKLLFPEAAMSSFSTTASLPSTLSGETAESLAASLSDTINCISGIQLEQDKFLEIAGYLYRASPVIKMLERTPDSASDTAEILDSVSRRVRLAKASLDSLQESKESITSSQLHGVIKQMEGVIHNLGEGLASIPPSTFGDQGYAEIALRSLSEEMKSAQFEAEETTPNGDLHPEEPPIAAAADLHSEDPPIAAAANLHPEEPPIAAPEPEEVDLYSVQADVSDSSNYLSETDLCSILGNSETMISSSSLGDVGRYVEPPYESFFCPLTKKIIQDPVTIESGATFERDVIARWFQMRADQEEVTCPATGRKLSSRAMFPSIALKAIIHEWEDRNEKGQIKVIHAALSLASSDSMIMDALKDLKTICQRRPYRTRQVLSSGIIPLAVKLLEYKDSMIRHATLETLKLLAEDDDGKELIGKTAAISLSVRMISSRFQPVKHAALLLLVELSKSVTLSEKIGWVTGGILMLIRTKYDRFTDTFASEAASLILTNLAQSSPYNIKCMAENGFLEPLVDNLVGGSEHMKMKMAGYLAEVVLGQDDSDIVAQKASPTLVEMARSENAATRKAAFKALVPISSLHQNAKLLVEAGIAQIVAEEMFNRSNYYETLDAVKAAAGILANLLESDLDLQKIEVTSQGHTISSDYVAASVVYMLTSSTVDETSLSLVRTISCLMKWSMPNIVSAIRDSEACFTLVELINNPDERLAVAAIKLLIKLAQHMGETLVDKLCKTHGQPQGLIQIPSDMNHITERQVLSAKFLDMLPHENLQLNRSLLSGNAAATVIQTILQIQATGMRKNRYASDYLEGLVGILVRFTATLYEPQILYLVVNCDFTRIFTDLLMETTSAEVKRLAASGLKKLSVESIKLSKPPKVERRLSMSSFNSPRFRSSKSSGKNTVCPIHRGVCSAQTTFCLFVSGAVEALLLCLDHQDVGVVEAALSALSTLLDGNVDMEKSMNILNEMKATQQVMKLVKDHTEEGLLQKAFWMIERFSSLGGEDFTSVALQDRKFNSKLVNSFYHGDEYTKQIVEKILTHLRIMPGSTVIFS